MRKAAVAAAVVVLALVLLAVAVPRLVSLDSMKPRIVSVLEEKTGRTVGLSGVSLSLFPGIGVTISGLSVSGDPGHPDERLLSVPEAEVRLAIGPLFSGRAEFTTFILKRPRITFRKFADGTHSATTIANRLARRERLAPAPADAEEKVAVAIRSIRIEEAVLSLRIEEEGKRAETRWDIDPFTFRLSGIGGMRNEFEIETRIDGPVRGEISFAATSTHARGGVADPTSFHIDGKGRVFGQAVTVDGTMSAPQGLAEVDLTVAFPKIDMGGLAAVLRDPPAPLASAKPEGEAGITAKVSGNLQSLGFEVEADLTRAGWTVSEELRKFIDAPCTVVVQGHRFPDLLVVSNAELRFQPLLLIANAAFTPSTGAREWSASARIASLADFAKSRGTGPSRFAPTGRVTASGAGKKAGTGIPETYAVGVDLGDAGFLVPEKRIDLRALNGHVDLSPKAVAFAPLTGLLNGQRFTLRGNAALGPAPVGQVDFRMAYLDVDALFPPAENGGKKEGGKTAPARKETGAERKREVSARAALTIDAGKARGVEFTNLKGFVRYEKDALVLESVRAGLYGGEGTISGRIGLSAAAPDFRVKVSLKDVEAGEILTRKTSLKEFLRGPVSLSADLGGGMKDFADFSKTASGAGSLRMTGGRIRGVNLLATATRLAGLQSVAPQAGPGGETAGETPFSDLSADFRIDGGRIRTDALRIASDTMGLSGKAVLGFDKTLDFRGTLRLSKGLSERARGTAGKFLAGPSGSVEIPLVMSGPVASPAVAVDTEALARGVAGGLIRGLTDRIPGARPEEPAGAPDAAGKKPERSDPAKEVEGLIRKILPKK